MKEVKTPKKPLIFYYVIVFCIIIFLNSFIMPFFMQRQIKETDYGTFMTMTANKEIGEVQIQDNRILFTDKEGKNIYETGIVDDPGLVERLYDSGAVFAGDIIEEASPLISFILSWVLPIAIFTLMGQLLTKKLMNSEEGRAAVKDYIKSFMDRRCFELQFNVVDQADLLDAQIHPEKHRSLLVRVAGYSDYFVNLTPEIQNEIIKRSEHSAV